MSTLNTESVAGSARHRAEASAIETTRAVRELLATIDKQAEELQRLRTGVFHYAEVGGLSMFETLEQRESRHKSEIERLNGLLNQGADKIDELKRELRDARGTIDWYKEFRKEPTGELESTKIRLGDAVKACETLAGKLKAAEQERDKAQADARRTENHGGGHVTVLPVVTLPADWMTQVTADAKTVDTLKAELGAALHRATRAERKAASANLTNEELRKALTDIANECDQPTTHPWLLIGRLVAMATKALDSKKANG